MKIYFAAPIQKNKKSQIRLYKKIIQYLSLYGAVLTEKIGDEDFHKERQETNLSAEKIKQIYKFDSKSLSRADVIVAEVSAPSLGVGYEIGRMAEKKKPILCLCDEENLKELSPIIKGLPEIILKTYKKFADIKLIINGYFKSLEFDK